MTQRVHCILCSSVGRARHAGVSDLLFGAEGSWSVLQCTNRECGPGVAAPHADPR